MRDFSLACYGHLLKSLSESGYTFRSFARFLEQRDSRVIVLRHDVDKRPANSLAMAKLEAEQGIAGTYYFRAVPESWDENTIKEIASLGHEIGYHYENLALCNGNTGKAILDFNQQLNRLRQLAPVSTICMHGSPRSRWDSRELWKEYDYRAYGIVGEPYLDVDFSEVFYLTDTGMRWDGWKSSLRDKIPEYQQAWTEQGLVFRHTADIIAAAGAGRLPDRMMMTVHPQRWNDPVGLWIRESIMQKLKNVIKRGLILFR